MTTRGTYMNNSTKSVAFLDGLCFHASPDWLDNHGP